MLEQYAMKTKRVLVLLDMSREYCRMIISGITKYAAIKGGWNCFGYSEFNILITKPGSIVRLIDESDGLIAQDSISKCVLDHTLSISMPAVLIRGSSEDDAYSRYPYPSVVGNNIETVKIAFDHLHGQGFKKMAFCGYKSRSWSNERMVEFENITRTHNIPFFPYEVDISKTSEYFEELEELKKWLLTVPKPIAVFTPSDDVGWFVLEAAKNLKINVPDEIAVLGVENDELICKSCVPPLSSILRNIEKAGYEAAHALDGQFHGKKIRKKKIIIEPLYVVNCGYSRRRSGSFRSNGFHS
jgi:LacI family transcriptional regulator